MKILTRPTPLWLSSLILGIALTVGAHAAITLYTGSFAVASGGTYTDTNQTASSCAHYNGSKQLVSASGDCSTLGSFSGTSPIGYNSGTGVISCSTCAITGSNNNYSSAQSWTAPSVTCGSSSGVPCLFTWSCSIGTSANTCTSTATVPANAKCFAYFTATPTFTVNYIVSGGGGGSIVVGQVAQTTASLASNTLTVTAYSGADPNATFSASGAGYCL
jgi:hypothetical protein